MYSHLNFCWWQVEQGFLAAVPVRDAMAVRRDGARKRHSARGLQYEKNEKKQKNKKCFILFKFQNPNKKHGATAG